MAFTRLILCRLTLIVLWLPCTMVSALAEEVNSRFEVPKLLPSAPGGEVKEHYRRWEDKDQAKKQQIALEQGESIVTPVNTLQALPDLPALPETTADPVAAANLRAEQKRQARAKQAYLTSLSEAKATALLNMFKQSDPQPHTIIESRFTLDDKTQAKETNADKESAEADNPPIPAGEIFYAVMLTEINSDEPGPILAQVLNGRLKGARLLGEFKTNDESVTLSFKSLSLGANSAALTALAVDPATARTGIATDVDHHYFSRYGALLAASFLQGFGQAVQATGTKVTVNDFSVSAEADFSTADQVKIGIGQVGEALGDAAKKNFDRPNTIIVESGTAIGVLIMSPLQQTWIPEGKETGQNIFR